MSEQATEHTRPPTLLRSASYLADWVARRARADIQAALATHGLNTTDFGVLAALGDFGVVSQRQLADALGTDKGHVVRLIDQLERRDLLTRSPHPQDRRRHRIELTGEGRDRLAVATRVVEDVEAAHLAPLSTTERRTLVSLLGRLLDVHDQET